MGMSDWSTDGGSSDLAADQIGDEILGVGGRTAVTASEDFAVVGQGSKYKVYRRRQRRSQFSGACLDSVDRIVEMRCHVRCHVHARNYILFEYKSSSDVRLLGKE